MGTTLATIAARDLESIVIRHPLIASALYVACGALLFWYAWRRSM
jgi:hypothetical protein